MKLVKKVLANLFERNLTRVGARSIFVVLLLLLGTFVVLRSNTQAAQSTNLNFQSRLLTSSGALVPDGNYNIEFKLYSVSSGGTAAWTETRLNNNTQGVRVVNGYFSVNLGSVTGFPSTINWNEELWLTMNIGSTNGSCTPFSSCTPDGEMSPRIKLTAVPYAYRSGEVAQTNANGTSILKLTPPTSGTGVVRTLTVPYAASDADVCLSTGNCAGAGSGVTATTPGTTNRIAKFTSGQNIGDTNIEDTGTAVNILSAATSFTVQGGNMTLGTTSQAGALVLSDGSSNTGTIQTAALGQNTVYTLPDPGQATASICLSTGNCAGAGNGITGAGTAGQVAYFDATDNLAGTNNFFWDNSNIRLGIGTGSPSTKLHVSAGTAGDSGLTIEADTDNNDEADNPYIRLLQDSSIVSSLIGHAGANGQDALGNSLTNGIDNGLHIMSSTHLQLATANAVRLTVAQNGNVGVGTDSTPDGHFSVGTNSAFQINAAGAITNATSITSTGTLTLSGSSGTTGNFVDLSGTLTNTASGSVTGINLQTSINPASASSSEFRSLVMSALIPTSNSQTLTTVKGGHFETRYTGTGSATTLTAGYFQNTFPANSQSFGTITNAYGVEAIALSEFSSGTITGAITNATGVRVLQPSKANAGVTIANSIGIDVAAQSIGATSNIGVRIAKGNTYSLQLSSTDGTAASGITFGTDTNLYRSTGSTLKTDSSLIVQGNTGIGTSTFGTNNRLLVNAYSTVDNLATAQINTNAATNKGLVVQGFSGQTAALQQWQNSSGTPLAYIDAAGSIVPASLQVLAASYNVIGGTGISNVGLAVYPSAAGDAGIIVKGKASQTGDLVQLQDSGGLINASFNATGNQLTLGRVAGSGTVTQGKLLFSDGTTNNFATTLQSATMTVGSRTLTLPNTAGVDDTVCLLTLGNCSGAGSNNTLQAAYNADVDGSDAIIALTTADDSIIFRNPLSSGSDSTFVLKVEQLATGAVDGVIINHAGTGYALRVNDDGTDSDSTPFVIDNAGNVGIGTTSTNGLLTVGGPPTITNAYHVGTQVTDTSTSGSRSLLSAQLIANPASTSTANYYGITGQAGTSSGNAQNFTAAQALIGISGSVIHRGSGTVTGANGLYISDAANTGGGTITSLYGLDIADQTTGLSNYGARLAVSSGSNKYNIYASGTAQNYFAGNVGIGTTPNAAFKLHVDPGGNSTSGAQIITATGNLAATSGIQYGIVSNPVQSATSSGTLYGLYVRPDAATGVTLTNSTGIRVAGNAGAGTITNKYAITTEAGAGNVGIGITAPEQRLHVVGRVFAQNSASGARSTALQLHNTADVSGVAPYGIGMGPTSTEGFIEYSSGTSNTSSFGHRFLVNGTNVLELEGTGNVGIGTASPGARLEVGGTITNASANQIASYVSNTFNGAGDSPVGLSVQPSFNPSAGITSAFAFQSIGSLTGASNVSGIYGANFGVVTQAGYSGALSNSYGINVQSATFSGTKPTTSYGVRIGNQGASGVTDTYGLWVATQSGSTNNYAAIFQGGNVGIGVINPDYKLKIDHLTNSVPGDLAAYEGIQIRNTSTTVGTGSGISLHSNVTGGATSGIFSRGIAGDQSTLEFYTEGTGGRVVRLYIDPTGNVGVGNTNNAYRLDVQGALRLQPTSAPTAATGVMYFDTTASKFKCSENGSSFVDCISTSANTTLQQAYGNDADGSDAIIALTTADDSLIVRNPLSSGSDSNFVIKVEQLNTAASQHGLIINHGGGATSFALRVNDDGTDSDSTPFVVDQDGSVGIGTTTPQEKLHVAGKVVTDNNQGFYSRNAANSTSYRLISLNASDDTQVGPNAVIRLANGAPADAMYVQATTGNVGIGTTSPSYKLQVAGDTALQGGNSFYNSTVGSSYGFRIDEATTNLITNPSVEVNATNYSTPFNANNTGARDTAQARFGTASFKANRITSGYGDSRMARYTDGVSYGTGTYTVSAWVYVNDAAIGTAQLDVEQVTSVLTSGAVTTSGGIIGSWVKITRTFTVTSAGTFHINLNAGINQLGSVYIDGLQLELKSYATSYADGSLGAGYAWTGTANASTSTRTIGQFVTDGNISTPANINAGGTVRVGTLGSATTPVAVCRNSSNELSSCGVNSAGVTLQQAYDADADGSNTTIALTTADDSLIVSNPLSSGSDSSFVMKVEQLNTAASKDTLIVTHAGGATSYALRVNDDGTDTDSTPFVIDQGGNVGIGLTTPDTKLSVAGAIDVNSAGLVYGIATNNVQLRNNYKISTDRMWNTGQASWALTLGDSGDGVRFYRAPATAGAPSYASVLSLSSAGVLDTTTYSAGGISGATTTCSGGQFLQNQVTTGGITTGGTCATVTTNTTLQQAYGNDADGSDTTIALTTADDSLIISNPSSNGTDSTFALKVEQLNTGAKDGVIITQAGTGFAFRVNDDGTDTDSTPFVVDQSGNVGVGTSTPGSSFETINYARILGSSNGTTGVPVSGEGLEFTYDSTANVSYINSYDRSASAYRELRIAAGTTILGTQGGVTIGTNTPGSEKLHVEGTTVVQADSANAFRVQNAAGTATLLNADTSTNLVTVGTATGAGSLTGRDLVVEDLDVTTKIRIGDGTNGVSFNDQVSSKLRLRGTARNDRTVNLVPEFEGAVLNGTGIGSMTSDFCSHSALRNINSTTCPTSGDEHTYYSWTTTQASAQTYDMYVRWQVPSDYDDADAASTTINAYGWRTNSTDELVQVSVFDDNDASGSPCGAITNVATGTATWTQTGVTLSSCDFDAGEFITFKVRFTAGTNDFARLGEIKLTYKSIF